MKTKDIIKQALKESREGQGTITLREIAELLKEVLSKEEVEIIIVHLKSKTKQV